MTPEITAALEEVKRLDAEAQPVEPVCVFCGKSVFDSEHCGLGRKVGWDVIVRPLPPQAKGE